MTVARTPALEAYLQQNRVQHISWHLVLNNHASTRPKAHGGQIVPAITKCKTYSAPGPASAVWECTLDLPHSFAAGDGLRVQTNGQGASTDEASEVVCLRAVAHLISARPSRFLLRPKHWAVTPQELLAHLPGADAGHQALPVHIPARLRDAGKEATTPDADARTVALVRRCLHAHGGEFDPSWISSKLMGVDPG